jgi:hypothetical protein
MCGWRSKFREIVERQGDAGCPSLQDTVWDHLHIWTTHHDVGAVPCHRDVAAYIGVGEPSLRSLIHYAE